MAQLKDTVVTGNFRVTGSTIASYFKTSGAGGITIGNGADLTLQASTSTSTDPGDIVFRDDAGTEIGRIYKPAGTNAFLVRFSASGTSYTLLDASRFVLNGTTLTINT